MATWTPNQTHAEFLFSALIRCLALPLAVTTLASSLPSSLTGTETEKIRETLSVRHWWREYIPLLNQSTLRFSTKKNETMLKTCPHVQKHQDNVDETRAKTFQSTPTLKWFVRPAFNSQWVLWEQGCMNFLSCVSINLFFYVPLRQIKT